MSTNRKKRNQMEMSEYQKEFIDSIKSGKPVEGKDGILTKLIKQFLETALEGEIEHHFSKEPPESINRRNGYTSKSLRTGYGEVEIDTPRDRESKFEPTIVEKRQCPYRDCRIIER